MATIALEWLRRGKNDRQVLGILAVGLLLILLVLFSAIRGGEEEDKGELRTKTLVYESNGNSGMGLYWMDDKANLRKATPEEIKRCETMHPDEVVPTCQTTYYEKDEDKR